MIKQTNQAPIIKTGRDLYVVKILSKYESDDIAEVIAKLKHDAKSYSQWRREIMEECLWAFQAWGLKLAKSRDSYEIAFHSLEEAEQAVAGLEPEIRRYVKAVTLTPVSFGGII